MLTIRDEIITYSKTRRSGEGLAETEPFSESELVEIEKRLGVKLPDDYRYLASVFGTMEFDLLRWSVVKVIFTDGSQERGLVSYLANYKSLAGNIDRYSAPHPFYPDIGPRIPPGMLPIGRVLMRTDGLLLLQTGDHQPGSVWAWNAVHETWGVGQNTILGFIAPDLQTFFDRIELNNG